jgi:arylsulfatase A-like enzyme
MDPNICIVVLDAVRAKNLSCYGHTRTTTPNIDSIIDESILFEKAVSPAAVTLDSTASLFTGLYPGAHRTGQQGKIEVDVPLLPELALKAEYTTGAVTTNPFITPGFGFERGVLEFMSKEYRFKDGMNIRKFFDRNKDRPAYQIYLQFLLESLDRNFISNVGNALQFRFDLFTREDNGAKETTSKVLDFISDKEAPWFLYTHYSEPHMKNVNHLYKLPDEYKYKYVDHSEVDKAEVARNPDKPYRDNQRDIHERLYDGTLRYLDTQVGEIIDQLKSDSEWDNTLFVLTADHGECLGEHSVIGHGHLYEEGVNVPLIVKPPIDFDESLGRRNMRINTLGLYETISALINDGELPDHVSTSSIFTQEAPTLIQDYSGSWSWSSYEDEVPGKHALYDDEMKLIKRGDNYELYDLDSDPTESRDLAGDHPKERDLREELENILADFGNSTRSTNNIEMSEDTSQQLEDLGYL